MKIHEYQAKKFFSSYGIPVERHKLCANTEEAVAAWKEFQPKKIVVKAQVLAGGRGKAGGIKLAQNETEVRTNATSILGMKIKGYVVKKILISEAVDIESEYYISFIIDRNTKSVLLMMSSDGGMDIETVAKNTPNRIYKFSIDPLIGLPDYLARKYAFLFFNEISQVNQLAAILQNLYRLFLEKDASLTEINPLIRTHAGQLIAIDAKMAFDDNALFRHPDVITLFEPTPEEKTETEAKEKGFSYVHLDGNIGCMVNGAGLAMATMDMIKLYGGQPANFLDIGGSSNPQKVINAMKLLLSDKQVKVVLINIFGGITRCDDVASGLIVAFDELKTMVPIVVRLTGTNEKEGRELLKGTRLLSAETMSEATHLAVKSSGQIL
ncbi:MAG: ADP-forming succinate--CoA ligase subunit beta [Massilibacteroides sp.]|nr:ADP-forming succinate--CoA ligase subunit beta [Massilibacteroides sp.]MDD3061522.1 ADP-forming succinate--CoA ligase subunit beta [Massilibacteroides sp.]MDD4114817.1 ADP-forming succinate--CoA ligase subunit beta [Massilibacteroides sp.]MDD4659188.1 ADP-forming succinate--CoA ligase subunit beta [Massilibacteroides sp.]